MNTKLIFLVGTILVTSAHAAPLADPRLDPATKALRHKFKVCEVVSTASLPRAMNCTQFSANELHTEVYYWKASVTKEGDVAIMNLRPSLSHNSPEAIADMEKANTRISLVSGKEGISGVMYSIENDADGGVVFRKTGTNYIGEVSEIPSGVQQQYQQGFDGKPTMSQTMKEAELRDYIYCSPAQRKTR